MYKKTILIAAIASLLLAACSNRETARERLNESASSEQNRAAEGTAATTDSTSQNGNTAAGNYNSPSKDQNQSGNRTNYSSDKAVKSQSEEQTKEAAPKH